MEIIQPQITVVAMGKMSSVIFCLTFGSLLFLCFTDTKCLWFVVLQTWCLWFAILMCLSVWDLQLLWWFSVAIFEENCLFLVFYLCFTLARCHITWKGRKIWITNIQYICKWFKMTQYLRWCIKKWCDDGT